MEYFLILAQLSLARRLEETDDCDRDVPLQRRTRAPRLFLPRCGLHALTDSEVKKRFRLNRATILDLYGLIKLDLEPSTRRTRSIPGIVKLLAVLHFLATGSFQSVSSPIVGMRIPNVLGAIDCTHIALVPPSSAEEHYRNRKKFHSFNVQAVCDSKLQIWEVRSGFHGSCHDYHILKQSQLYTSFERGEMPHADSGYPCRPWRLTPVPNPKSESEMHFNEAHRSTRSAVERTFGVLKMRFRALDRTGGVLLYSPEKVNYIILVCCMLHNMAVQHGDADNLEIFDLPQDDYSPPEVLTEHSTQNGVSNRKELIERYFTC
ncbi:putative nuclease HARBI1 [Bombina bombina]|uniref:putative nuclease HARBI1 n=1 Tax=Bombina bombina TaxID=8345 RepID=UPI00235B109B|nr:putative nuclease HARBI1 [Bombina bombina]